MLVMEEQTWICVWIDKSRSMTRTYFTSRSEVNPVPVAEEIEMWMRSCEENHTYMGILVRSKDDGTHVQVKPIGSWKKRKPTFIVRKVADPM